MQLIRSKSRKLGVMAGAMLLLVSVIVTMTSCGNDDAANVKPSIGGSTNTPDSSSGPTTSGETVESFVATYFYYWYDLPDGPHSIELTHRPTTPDASYESIDWFMKQLTDMSDASIDVALAVYWGEAEPSSDIGLANMASAYDQLQTEGQATPSIAMFPDTGARSATRPISDTKEWGPGGTPASLSFLRQDQQGIAESGERELGQIAQQP